jgi:hypothetical protein
MELVDRYVTAVAERLHPARRPKVEAELRAAILDALEARAGLPTQEEAVVAVLAELGAPERMAAGYEPGRQYLIGPELYPLFRRGLRVAMVAIVVASVVSFGVSLLVGGLADFRAGGLLVDTLRYAFTAALVAAAGLVAVFAWLQRAERQIPRTVTPAAAAWDPRSLAVGRKKDATSRFEALSGLVAAAVVLVVVGVIGLVAREVEPGVSTDLQPLIRDGVARNVLLVQVALVLSAVAHGIALLQGHWPAWTRGMRLVAYSVALFVFVRLPFQLLEYRSALLDAGVTRHGVTWLIANAFIFGATFVAIVLFHWWRSRRASH